MNYDQLNKANKKDIIKTIEQAKGFFENNAWGRMKYYDPTHDTYCTLGAIKSVLGVPLRPNFMGVVGFQVGSEVADDLYNRQTEVYVCLEHAIRKMAKLPAEHSMRVSTWNDTIATSKEDVQAFYDYAIELLKKEIQ